MSWLKPTRQSLAKPDSSAQMPLSPRKFGMRDLWRMALWGISASAALTLVTYAGTTVPGQSRMHLAIAEIHENLIPSGTKPIRPLDAREGRRLAETVRTLAADRERLISRVATLEQSIDDITGSIARVEKAAKAPAPPPDPAPAPSPAQEDVISSISPPAIMPLPPQPPAPSKPEFGLDLGSANSVEALRTAWAAALRRHGKLLEGLGAVVQTRERSRPGGMEMRLIAGPLPNAATAARLCATMTAAGAICAPTMFGGQRLAGY
jgi:hypothetical protein